MQRGRDIAWTHKWLSVIISHIAMRRQQKEWRRRVDYAQYFQRVHWIVVRARAALDKKILRQGPTIDERLRRYIKDSMISLSTMTDFTRYQAGTMVASFLEKFRERKKLHRNMVDFHFQIRKIK